MKEILRSTDPVTLSHAEALLAAGDITCFLFDQHMSILEGSIGVLPSRLMVADRDLFMAQSILRDAGLLE